MMRPGYPSRIEPIEGCEYIIAPAFWPDDVRARFVDGKFIPEGYEDDPSRHFPPSLVIILDHAA